MKPQTRPENPPAMENAYILIVAALQAVDDLKHAHDDEPGCECERCHDARGLWFMLDYAEALLNSKLLGLSPKALHLVKYLREFGVQLDQRIQFDFADKEFVRQESERCLAATAAREAKLAAEVEAEAGAEAGADEPIAVVASND